MTTGRIWFFAISLIITFLVLFVIWRPGGILSFSNPEDLANVAVEFHGMVFDVILFGIILTLYELWSSKKQRIRRYQEEIDDFRGWDEKEAAYRLAGNIRRLNREGIYQIDLANCYLKGMNFNNADLSGANLSHADLSGANLPDADLTGANLTGADLIGANLTGANLTGANLTGANLSRAELTGAKFNGAKLDGVIFHLAYLSRADFGGGFIARADFNNADLQYAKLNSVSFLRVDLSCANLSHADLSGARLPGIDFIGADLSGALLGSTDLFQANLSGANLFKTKVSINELKVVKTLYECEGLEPALEDLLKREKPCLFEDPNGPNACQDFELF